MTPLYPPGSRVGAWLATHSYLRHLVSQGHTVDVIAEMYGGDGYELDGVRVRERTCNPAELATRADVVLSHLGDQGHAAQLAHRLNKPLVRMVHGNPADPDALTKYGRPSLVVFNSHASRQFVDWNGPAIVARPQTPDAPVTPGDRVTLVNLSANKGGEHLPILAALCPEVKFLGVKGGYGKQIVRHRPNLEPIDTVTDMTSDVWPRTRVLLVPSVEETWGMVAVEAMCSGIPVIAAPTGGLRESLGDAGMFIDRNDLSGWVAAIRCLMDPDMWSAASQRSRRRFEDLNLQDDLAVFTNAIERTARQEVAA